MLLLFVVSPLCYVTFGQQNMLIVLSDHYDIYNYTHMLKCNMIAGVITRIRFELNVLSNYSTINSHLTCREHLHIFVGQSSPSLSSRPTVCFQSCQLSVHNYLFISSWLLSIHLRLGHHFLLFPIQPCPSFFFRGCLLWCVHTNSIVSVSGMLTFGIGPTLASSCMNWFLTWSFLVLPRIRTQNSEQFI